MWHNQLSVQNQFFDCGKSKPVFGFGFWFCDSQSRHDLLWLLELKILTKCHLLVAVFVVLPPVCLTAHCYLTDASIFTLVTLAVHGDTRTMDLRCVLACSMSVLMICQRHNHRCLYLPWSVRRNL